MKENHLKKHIWCGVMLVLITAFDQLTKYLVTAHIKGAAPFVFIPKVVQFSYAENTGMAFSMLSGARWFFIALTLAVCAFGMWYLFSNRCKSLWVYWSIGVVIAGGIGNLIDRIRFGYVIDFIEPLFIDFAIFNIADSAVSLGATSLVIYLICDLFKVKEKRNAR
ncbi:MAG: signal peptidase II [Eubacterium sp.]|nr:signal peptidase II [Eubacterium sp.]